MDALKHHQHSIDPPRNPQAFRNHIMFSYVSNLQEDIACLIELWDAMI